MPPRRLASSKVLFRAGRASFRSPALLRRVLAAAALAALFALAAPSIARGEERVDPLMGTGIVLFGAAGLGVAIGAPLVASWGPTSRQVCGLNGCLTAHDTYGATSNNFPSVMLGAGIGAGVVAVAATAIGAAGRAPPVGWRRDEGVMNAGVWLTGMGASIAGAAIGGVVHGGSHGSASSRSFALPLGVTGGVIAAAGIPMIILGGLPSDDEPAPDRRLRSPARMYGGMVMSTLAVPLVTGGVYLMTEGSYGLAFGLGMVGLGAGLLGGGIALWATGAREVSGPRSALLPSVRVGLGSLSIEGAF